LLLVLEHGPGAEIMVSQKVFEYLETGRPILALVPEGAAKDLLSETGGAIVCSSRRVGDVANTVRELIERIAAGTATGARAERLQKYQRSAQAREFAGILDEMIRG
jgi:hypothetical protein